MRSSAEAHMGRFVHMRASWLCIIFLGWINGYFRAIVLRPHFIISNSIIFRKWLQTTSTKANSIWLTDTQQKKYFRLPHTHKQQTLQARELLRLMDTRQLPLTMFISSQTHSRTPELGFLAADEHNVIHLRRQCETFVHFARGRPSKRQFHSIFFLFFCSAIEFLFFLVL